MEPTKSTRHPGFAEKPRPDSDGALFGDTLSVVSILTRLILAISMVTLSFAETAGISYRTNRAVAVTAFWFQLILLGAYVHANPAKISKDHVIAIIMSLFLSFFFLVMTRVAQPRYIANGLNLYLMHAIEVPHVVYMLITFLFVLAPPNR